MDELHPVSQDLSCEHELSEILEIIENGTGSLHQRRAYEAGFDAHLTKPVAVRLHSACLTGDLFGSLKCDCGDPLGNPTDQAFWPGDGRSLGREPERGARIASRDQLWSSQVRRPIAYQTTS